MYFIWIAQFVYYLLSHTLCAMFRTRISFVRKTTLRTERIGNTILIKQLYAIKLIFHSIINVFLPYLLVSIF